MAVSLELMRSFVEGIEVQVDNSIVCYHKEKETLILEEIPEQNYCREVTIHQGIDDETFDLDGVFLEYFPSLQRSSAFLSLYGLFENKLNKLCALCMKERVLNLSVNDLKGGGIVRATIYLKKMIGIDTCKSSKEWKMLHELIDIRNLIAHQAGKFEGDKGRKVKEYLYQMGQVGEYYEDEVVLKKGFLEKVIFTFESYLKLLDESIKEVFA
jgi:hypothetical protein